MMRACSPVLGLVVLATLGCSVSASEGPRPTAEQGGAGLGGGAGGTPSVIPGGGSTSVMAGANSGGSPVTMGGSPTTAGAAGMVAQGGSTPVDGSKAHVMTWVPPYHIQDAKQQLSADFGGTGMAEGLSFLGLQFFIVDGAGTRLDKVTEGDISWFYDWAKQHGVKIMFCVHNNVGGDWNWPEAVRSFKDNKDAFAQHLLSQVMMRDFDGVDLDLEGIVEATDDDKSAYIAFAQTLATGLHSMGKALTVDSFHGQWNAPNWNWWPELLPIVDGITSMGYEQSGLDVDYQNLVDHAQVAPKKLMIGVPSYHGTWLNHSVGEQLGWLVQQGQVGTAIWDASLQANEWQTAAVWQQLKAIKAR